eukprot:scaffold304720_cov33-Tisochrysis_lutea.AAC.1
MVCERVAAIRWGLALVPVGRVSARRKPATPLLAPSMLVPAGGPLVPIFAASGRCPPLAPVPAVAASRAVVPPGRRGQKGVAVPVSKRA